MPTKKKIAIVLNTAWNIYNFRRNLVRRLSEDYEVVLIAPDDEYVKYLEPLNCKFIEIKKMDKRGKNPFLDFSLLLELRKIFAKENPDIILTYTIKPNIFGNLAAPRNSKVISTVTGRGRIDFKKNLISFLIKKLYRKAFRNSNRIFFQNPDDFNYFLSHKLIDKSKCVIVPGSGVDLQLFHPNGEVNIDTINGKIIFLLVARLLLAKGIKEYAEAAKLVKKEHPDAEFWLLGPIDDNPNQINEAQIKSWEKEGAIKYRGVSDNVKDVLSKANVIVLPSYYGEGVPRTLLESLSMQKPIITTNHPGCKETVDDGVNGYLIPTRNVKALTDAMRKIIKIGPAARAAMGKKSREKAVKEFDDKVVIATYLKEIDRLI